MPDFKQAFQHFLIHTGGQAVIEEVEKRLELTPDQCRASKDTLHRFGNTCCAAVFYVLTNMEAKVRCWRKHARPEQAAAWTCACSCSTLAACSAHAVMADVEART